MTGDPSNGYSFDPGKLVLKLRISLAADKNAIDPVVQGVMEVVRNTHFVSGKEDAIELALSEALANAVIHGAKGDPKKIVECDVAYDGSRGMLIVVHDPGQGFGRSGSASPVRGEHSFSNLGWGSF